MVNVAAGVSAGLSVKAFQALVAPSWHPIVGMFVGMLLGSLVASLLSFLFMPFLGAFEVMLPAMLTGMVSGMAATMLEAPVLPGALIGLAVVGWVYFLTAIAGSRNGRSNRA